MLSGRLKVMANISRFLFFIFIVFRMQLSFLHTVCSCLVNQTTKVGLKREQFFYVCAILRLSSYNPNITGPYVVE